MSQKSAPVATPVKKSSKPTLSQQALDDEAELQTYLTTIHKPLSSKSLISHGQKQIFAEAEQMSQAQVEEEIKKAKRAKGLAEEVEVPPSQYKYKLDPAQQKQFLKDLAAADIPADIKANLDILVNTIPKAPQRPFPDYFQFSQNLRDKLKQQGITLGVVEFSARVKAEYEKLSDKAKNKLKTQYQKDLEVYQTAMTSYRNLLEIQKKAVEFYASKLKNIVVKSPQDIAKDEKEALENHGVKWRAHIPESLMKKMVMDVPNFDLKPSPDFCRTLNAAAEAYVVYLGQQTALRTVRMGKKTVQGVVLKATAGDLPQVAIVGHFPSFVEFQIDKKTMEKVKTSAASKKADKTADVDAKQPKLKLITATKTATSSAFDMDDTDTALAKSKSKKTTTTSTKGKSVTELLSDDEESISTKSTKGNKAAAPVVQAKKDTALKSMLEKSTAKAQADPTAAAKAKQMDDDDMSVVATPTKAKKASIKKGKKDDKQDPLYIPEDATGVDANIIAKLKKEKLQYDNVMEITAPNGDVNYVDGDSEELETAIVNKYLAFKTKIQAIQSKSPSFVAAHTVAVKGKNAKAPTYADSDDDVKPKGAQKRKAQQQAVDDTDDDVVVVTAQVSKKQKKQDKDDKQVVLPAAKKGPKK